MRLQELLEQAVERNASDLHLCTGYAPTFRVDGRLTAAELPALSEDATTAIVAELLPNADAAAWRADAMASAELNHEGPRGERFRVAIHKHFGGTGLTLRRLPSVVPEPTALGMSDAFVERVCTSPKGLVLVSGGTGSGKSTTLYSLVEHINATAAAHIICLGNPTEYVLQPKRSLVRTIEIGTNMPSYAVAARTALRLDPDIVVIGEMVDLETVQLAITLAETGHLVFTTIHCWTVPEALARVVEVFPSDRQAFIAKQLAATVECVIAQRLHRRASGQGRVAVQEILLANDTARQLIAERRFGELLGVLAESTAEGMQTMHQHLRRLVEAGEITAEEAARAR